MRSDDKDDATRPVSISATFDPAAAAGADSGVFGLPYSFQDARVIVLPVPFAATTSYGGGAQNGPRAVYEASKQVDLYDVEIGRPYEAQIHMLEEDPSIAQWHSEARADAALVIEAAGQVAGDPKLQAALERVNVRSAKVNNWVYEQTKSLIAQRKLVALVGGDHSTPLGAIRALSERHHGMGILHIDAHADLRVAYEGFQYSHASIMYNVLQEAPGVSKIVQVGIRDFSEDEANLSSSSGGRVLTFYDTLLARKRFRGETWAQQCEQMVSELPQKIYISFDIDGLDPALCPHTGTPVAGGLSFAMAHELLRAVADAGKTIVGVDLNEVVPAPDGSEWDGNVGARLLYKMIGWMAYSNGLIDRTGRG
jgi:agmatinase